MRRFRSVAAAVALPLALASGLGGCGSARTELPSSVVPPPPLEADPVDQAVETEAVVTESEVPVTTASVFKSAGEKHPIPGGTLAPSYPRVGVRPPRGVAPPPAGQLWAVVNARFCAADDSPIAGSLIDPGRFRVEVPGQGDIAPSPDAPALAKDPLVAGSPDVEPGTCREGYMAFLVAGEGHIESISYDSGEGLLRWAT